ncbi:MAG: pyruvate, phosphate dikinase, partial [Phycisphaerales bacterium]
MAKPRTKASGKKPSAARKKAPSRARSTSAKAADRLVFSFGNGKADAKGAMKQELGGKGANLAEMTRLGLPVPPGFTISTRACAEFNDNGGRLTKDTRAQIRAGLDRLERAAGKKLGDAERPLLVSVRSGAAVSMPGMMDTVLNLGLNDETVLALARSTDNERFAYDAYRRLISMFGDVVMGVEHAKFERALLDARRVAGVEHDHQLDAGRLRELCARCKDIYRESVGEPFPQEPFEQLIHAVEAVFQSWNTPRAVRYRQINEIRGLLGTAVNVQAMVFGNMGDDSGTGVAFTRNPSTGENTFYGEFLVNAQGEDVVAGIRTPRPLSEMAEWDKGVYDALVDIKKRLETHYKDVQDIEFTVERGELFMLQTRTGKRTGPAAVRIAVEMNKQRLIDRPTALRRVPAAHLTQLLLPSFTEKAKKAATRLCTGLPASPGAAVGKPAFSADEAVRRARDGESVILVRKDTSPEDIDGMHSAAGILTSTGGMTSHAAVVARGWGKCCVAGAGDLHLDEQAGSISVGERQIGREDTISIDGATGEVMLGAVSTSEPELSGEFATLMKWADAARDLRVRTNADTPEDAQRARSFGAEGIGLCRTEHMFFDPQRITAMREMILADSREHRDKALGKLLPYQRKDFAGIFEAMDGLPVTVRLLDPPLHEFLPRDDASLKEIAHSVGVSVDRVRRRVAQLHETNPMLGHRGVRLAITYPEIAIMQVAAIVEAAIDRVEAGGKPRPEIMVPLTIARREMITLRTVIEETIRNIRERRTFTKKLHIPIGTMIEAPRAALRAAEIAKHADFFSFGTNDLTQMTFGFSRDDVNSFLPSYLEREILDNDPFQSLDQPGVGRLVRMAVE